MHDFHRLDVWKLSRRVAGGVYRATETLPKDEAYGLKGQMRRASVSVASNIAEGASRGSPKEFRRFLQIAAGSANELETQLLIAADAGLVPRQQATDLAGDIARIRKMLYSLERSATPPS
ncbi:MAG: four helix bundle protein [Acidimicrobiia bacterium]|nr:four helix bundle protein [Acidimicrobiia bacterium]